ncbi:MAG: exodeoxyribonuclease VII large subunit, partial [Alphaproteobacteria bacterium]|nr:exodeoxyribonuclease VII large subunit [Alphaproteobacteria bacterium]
WLNDMILRLKLHSPAEAIARAEGRIASEARALKAAFAALVSAVEARVSQAGALLESVSYLNVLKRGYAVVRDEAGLALAGATEVKAGARLALEFHDGRVSAVAEKSGAEKGGAEKGGSNPAAPPKGSPPAQGKLL